ncbi:uncharacterized protein LOC114352315 isoform X10 [Ostrinia furnacalis]|uniref:uncharacterized protein LOC114352315 isoform X10 n=1 Tax=Ostrinia furnacalis TaxID=93504 RepID=UPI00103FB5FC|nr:uncharacterized protein LOC114352315 isoform X10 [Ostrinia furnacalis]
MTSQDKTFPNDIVQLSRSRAAFKGKLTQFTNFMDNLATPLSPDDILNLEFRIENVTSTYEKFDTIQMQLECLSEDTSSQLLEREKFEELYFESLAKAKGLVMAFRNDNDEPEAKPSHSSECIDSIKFPEIALPSFSGDFREWLEFRETFDALINQSSLKSIQKFKYLRSCLKDGALEVVNSIEYTSDGYQMAWRLLCERYNNPRLLVSNHLRSLFEIPSISSENAKSLRALIDNINKHLRSLHTLNIPIDDWDLIIIYFMSNKLPSSLQRSWEENQSSNVLPSLQDFKNFIRRRADILDNLNVTKPGGPEARKSLVTTSSKPIVNPSCPQCKGLETHSFLSAFRRFIARRGKPRVVVSDNGTTFRGADRELRELYDFLNTNSNELTTSCTEQGIEWKFVPSYSPHMNGLAEGAVKSCKYHLKRVLKQSLLTYEGFSTILIQIEGILNSRPLCPIPFSDSEIFQVLTPAHFLIGRTPVALPDYQYDEVPTNRLKYFQQLQQIYQSFWKGFSRDYVGLLQQRGKWQSSKGPTLAAGSVVLIKDKHTPPCQWRLARIIETHPGGDGVTRVATLRTSQGSNIKLSFPRICPLPILDNN